MRKDNVTTDAAAETDVGGHRLANLATLILNAAGDGIFGMDSSGKTTFVNPAAEGMLRWDAIDLIGRPLHESIHHSRPDGSPYPATLCPVHATLTDGAVRRVDGDVFWRKDGSSFPVEYTSTPIVEGGKVMGAVVTFRDVSERERVSRQLERLAMKDDLTGLHNRRGFIELAQQQLLTARRRKAGMTLLYIDVDDLKPINDRFGHAEGDRALIAVGELLAATFRASDVTGRVGGDEFCVLLTEGDVRDHAAALVRLERAIERRNEELGRWRLSVSAGHATFDPERPVGVEELIRAADASMYEEKRIAKKRAD